MNEKIEQALKLLIEEVYEVTIEELPSISFCDITLYAEATRNNIPKSKWKTYKLKRDKVGFTIADDKFLELLLKTEKLYNITIKDEEAERMRTINDLNDYVIRTTKKEK